MTRDRGFDFAEARRRLAGKQGRRFWSSLEEIIDQDEFRAWLTAEFPSAAAVLREPERRHVLKLMGASLLLAGLTGCGDDRVDLALPYVNSPEAMVPGVPRLYATAIPFEGYIQPVLATTHAGRPTKLDGNPQHPVSTGASDPFTQAAVLQLYDPDRSQTPLRDDVPATWAAFQSDLLAMRRNWADRKGEGLRFLAGEFTSPTLIRQIKQLLSDFPAARLHVFEPVGSALRGEGLRSAFGRDATLHYRLENCDALVSIDDDPLGPGPSQVLHARAWSQRRGEAKPGQNRITMHLAECIPSLTGAVASTRVACDPSRLAALARFVAAQLGVGTMSDDLNEPERRWASQAAAALREHRGRSLFAVGAHLPAAIQTLAPLVNHHLGNSGSTVWYSDPITFQAGDGSSLGDLVHDISAGTVDTLVMVDCNPVYTAPGDLAFANLLPRVRERIHLGLYRDETAQLCHRHLPLTHALESWSDGRAVDGTASIIQPLLTPLYGGRNVHQFLDMLLGTVDPPADAAVRATWTQTFGSDFDRIGGNRCTMGLSLTPRRRRST